jgi:acyl-CoA synthetase (AMP-forming)/AMP-acid ligase II
MTHSEESDRTVPTNLGDTLRSAAGQRGEQTALIDCSGDAERRFTFNQLDARIAALAGEFSAFQGSRIGLLGANSVEFVATLLALMRCGAVAVPINYRFPDETVNWIVEDAELQRVFVDAGQAGRLAAQALESPLRLDGATPLAGSVPVAPRQAGLVLYTSGSTGRPKGVELSHFSQWAMVARMSPGFKGITGIVAAPLYHMNGLLYLMCLLDGGGSVVLMPRFQAREYLQAIHDHRVNAITGVPTMLSLLLKEQDLLERLDFSCLGNVSIGSAPLSEALIAEVARHFPNATIRNGYGTTEAGAGMFGPHPEGLPVPPLSLGAAQPHVAVRLTGGPSADEGVLQVHTPAAMNGYLNQPEKTAAKLSGEGWINTGDIMRRDANGFYYFVGRDDDMFNCGGENVYPGNVERVLEADPGIAESCVVPVADELKGRKPVAFVVTTPGAQLDEDAVKSLALAALPAFMHPRQVFFLDTMPLAGTNKIDRRALIAEAERRLAQD